MGVFWSCLIAFLSTAGIIRALRAVAPYVGLVDNPDGLRKRHEGQCLWWAVSRFTWALSCLMMAWTPVFEGLPWLMAGGLLLVGVGARDDYRPSLPKGALPPTSRRLYWRSTGPTCGSMTWVICPSTGACSADAPSVLFTVFTMVGIINAINLSDGVYGLAGTLTVWDHWRSS